MRLAGKVAIVTGGASGIGRASALRFAAEGARVMVADLNGDGARAVAHEIRADGGTAHWECVDVTQASQVESAWQRTHRTLGGLNIVFNNAGLPQPFTPVEDTTLEEFVRLLSVNVIGVFNGCQSAIPLLREHLGGVIINMAPPPGSAQSRTCCLRRYQGSRYRLHQGARAGTCAIWNPSGLNLPGRGGYADARRLHWRAECRGDSVGLRALDPAGPAQSSRRRRQRCALSGIRRGGNGDRTAFEIDGGRDI